MDPCEFQALEAQICKSNYVPIIPQPYPPNFSECDRSKIPFRSPIQIKPNVIQQHFEESPKNVSNISLWLTIQACKLSRD